MDLTLKTENKDDIVKQAQRTAEQLAAKLQQVEYDKEEYYEAVIEVKERIRTAAEGNREYVGGGG